MDDPKGRNVPVLGAGIYEVWRVSQSGERTWERSFSELRLALRYVHVQSEGRYDIRMPGGGWFSERGTERARWPR